jgi:hypothetical protein
MTVLVIAPTAWHAAALAGGSVRRWSDEGRRAVLAVPDGGDVLQRVASLLGAEVAELEWSDSFWTSDSDGRSALTDVFRRETPQVTVAPATTASGPRARAIGRMAFDAGFCATVPHYRTLSATPSGGSRTAIVELDDPFAPVSKLVEYVDTTAVHGTVAQAVEIASGSVPDGEFTHRRDPVEVADVISRTRGLQIQVERGEAFSQVRVYGRLRGARQMP